MHLSEGGQAAKACWQAIPDHFPETKLHASIVMPDHIHGIIEITSPRTVRAQQLEPPIEPPIVRVQQLEPNAPSKEISDPSNQYQHLIPGSIGAIVRGFKIGVTKWFKQHKGIQPIWHRNYYEHIIKSQKAYLNITNYIINNPKNYKQKSPNSSSNPSRTGSTT